jgi:DNA-directed RNA polymerase subunit RPC12/RpoP
LQKQEFMMASSICETCGNRYDRLMRIELHGQEHFFDSFECAIQKLAPHCAHCGTRILGHGMEANSQMYGCAHCSRAEGQIGLRDTTHDLIEAG